MLKTFRRNKGLQLTGLISPGVLWILLFFNLPLLIVLFISRNFIMSVVPSGLALTNISPAKKPAAEPAESAAPRTRATS